MIRPGLTDGQTIGGSVDARRSKQLEVWSSPATAVISARRAALYLVLVVGRQP